jgi:phosphopantothenoylcysteine decarboxylase/phosphopantothenate--cysteine ligase
VTTAAEMDRAVKDQAGRSQIIIMAAAVSDFRPVEVSDRKIKKNSAPLRLTLEPTTDILHGLGKAKEGRILVGFAAETDAIVLNAREKLTRKNLDLIIANDITASDSGFAADTNRATMIDRAGTIDELPSMTKAELAARIIDKVVELKKNQGL